MNSNNFIIVLKLINLS